MKIETTDLATINEAEYDPDTDTVRVTIIARSADFECAPGSDTTPVEVDLYEMYARIGIGSGGVES